MVSARVNVRTTKQKVGVEHTPRYTAKPGGSAKAPSRCAHEKSQNIRTFFTCIRFKLNGAPLSSSTVVGRAGYDWGLGTEKGYI